jgi:8-oxo-dGTP diphosphatase
MTKYTTLCYLERGGCWLMLHRIKKKNDVNHDKWIGVGGKFEPGETAQQCLLREVREETGLTLTEYRRRGIVTFVQDEADPEEMHLYTATGWTGTMIDGDACDEGRLEWVEKAAVDSLPIWQGDRVFFALLAQDAPFFRLLLRYRGETLAEAVLDGVPLPVSAPGSLPPGTPSPR